jgi:MurNAc alpha-1-phosphate uridylyltransferase
MKCMILAAGYGKRMMPLTKETPKPLLKIGNETLLDRNIKNVLLNDFDEIIINVSHHGDKIKEHLIKNYIDHKITLVEEPHPYGTGGALVNAKDQLGDGTILIINADIFHVFDLSKLNREIECIHLVGIENPDHNKDGDFNIGPDGKVFCDDINKLTWSGISLLNTDVLSKVNKNNFPFDSWSSIVLPQIKEGKVTGEIYSDIWLDVGTKDRLELANKIIREEN